MHSCHLIGKPLARTALCVTTFFCGRSGGLLTWLPPGNLAAYRAVRHTRRGAKALLAPHRHPRTRTEQPDGDVDAPSPPRPSRFTLVEEGGSFTGTMTGPMGEESDLQNLNIDGNKFGFKADIHSPMGKMTLGVNGVVQGGTISGDFETPMGPNPFRGERK